MFSPDPVDMSHSLGRQSGGWCDVSGQPKFCRVRCPRTQRSFVEFYIFTRFHPNTHVSGISRCGFYAKFEACMLWLRWEVLERIGGLLESESHSSFGNEIGSVCWLWHGCWVSLSLALADITSSSCPGRSSPFVLPAPLLQAVPKAEKGRINKETQIANAEGILGVESKDKNRSGETWEQEFHWNLKWLQRKSRGYLCDRTRGYFARGCHPAVACLAVIGHTLLASESYRYLRPGEFMWIAI